MTFRSILLAAGLSLVAGAASAATMTYNIVGSYSGGQLGTVAFDLTLTADFAADISDTTAGLTINSLTSTDIPATDPFAVAGGLGYRYNSAADELSLGGLLTGVFGAANNTNDFLFQISDFSTSPSFFFSFDAQEGDSGIDFDASIQGSVTEVTAAPVPLPAAGLLLLGGLAVLTGAARRRRGATPA